MKPPASVDKYIRATYSNYEELLAEPPKLKRAVYADVPEIRKVIAAVKVKFPWLADSGAAGNANLQKIFSFLQEADAAEGWTQHNVEIAVELLHPELEYDPDYVPAFNRQPTAPVQPKSPAEVLEPGQLSMRASKRDLEAATADQIKDYLRRIHEAQAN